MVFDHASKTQVELAEGVVVYVIGLYFSGPCRFVSANGQRAMVCDAVGRHYDVELRDIISVPDGTYAEFIEAERRAPRSVSAWFVDKNGKGERREVTMLAGVLPRIWQILVPPEVAIDLTASAEEVRELKARVATYEIREEWLDGKRRRTWYQEVT